MKPKNYEFRLHRERKNELRQRHGQSAVKSSQELVVRSESIASADGKIAAKWL